MHVYTLRSTQIRLTTACNSQNCKDHRRHSLEEGATCSDSTDNLRCRYLHNCSASAHKNSHLASRYCSARANSCSIESNCCSAVIERRSGRFAVDTCTFSLERNKIHYYAKHCRRRRIAFAVAAPIRRSMCWDNSALPCILYRDIYNFLSDCCSTTRRSDTRMKDRHFPRPWESTRSTNSNRQ